MIPNRYSHIALGVLFLSSILAYAGQPASFSIIAPLPAGATADTASALSADGLSVAGIIQWDDAPSQAFAWTASTGRVLLDRIPNADPNTSPQISGILNNAQMVIGTDYFFTFDSMGSAFSWTPDAGLVVIEDVPGGLPTNGAHAFSGDGSVIVGSVFDNIGHRAAQWTESQGWSLLGSLPDGGISGFAYDVSDDGLVIVGKDSVRPANITTSLVFRWTAETGMTQVGTFDQSSQMRFPKISGDGSTIFGHLGTGQGMNAPFKWTKDGGLTLLPHPKDGFSPDSKALAASRDGSVLIGTNYTSQTGIGHKALIWDKNGVRTIQDALTQAGVDMTGWSLTIASGISDDGQTIVGSGIDPNGILHAWIATLPSAGLGCNQADFAQPYDELNFFDVDGFLTAFASSDPAADLNVDGSYDFFDVVEFLDAFKSGCP